MRIPRLVLQAGLVLGGLTALWNCAHGQAVDSEARMIQGLLSEAPIDAYGRLEESPAFVRDAAELLDPGAISTSAEAMQELEMRLAFFGEVRAAIESDPPGCRVRYHRVVDEPSEVVPESTTNDTLRVAPAWYYFYCENERMTVDCSRGCRVRF